MTYCEQTGKVQYESKYEAELVLGKKKKKRKGIKNKKLRNRINLDTIERASYKCEFCGCWHLAGK